MKPQGIPLIFRLLRMVIFHQLGLLKVQSCISLLIDWMDGTSYGGHNPWSWSLEEGVRLALWPIQNRPQNPMILCTMSGMQRILWFYHGLLTLWNLRSAKHICISALPNNHGMQWVRHSDLSNSSSLSVKNEDQKYNARDYVCNNLLQYIEKFVARTWPIICPWMVKCWRQCSISEDHGGQCYGIFSLLEWFEWSERSFSRKRATTFNH